MKKQTYFNTPLETMANICDMSVELSINCAGVVDDSSDISTHSVREDYYLIYVCNGSMKIEFDDFSGQMNKENLLILKPGTSYTYSAEVNSGINYLWIHFTGRDAKKTVEEFSLPFNEICISKNTGAVVELWKKLFYEFVINDNYFTKVSTGIFVEILAYFSRNARNINGNERLIKSIMYIHENYNKNIKTEYLAKIENLSESHYRTVFTHIVKSSPIEYITQVRISAAAVLLKTTDKKLSEISALVGYNDVYYFARQFKNKMGISPGKYRKVK